MYELQFFTFIEVVEYRQSDIRCLPTGVAYSGERCMFSAASVCLSVCQHDNFRTIKRRMMKLGGYVQGTKISPEFECQGQRTNVKVTGDKKRQCGILFGSRPLRTRPCAAFFRQPSSGRFYAGGKISACCLV